MAEHEIESLSEQELDRLPTGVSSFEEIRAGNLVYVDKTDLINSLALSHKRYFLSRPRRFGKTLLISTLESLFSRGIDDFKGLAIEKKWRDPTYEVLRLDFSTFSEFDTVEQFKTIFFERLCNFMEEHPGSKDISVQSHADVLSAFEYYLSLRPLGKLVVLIDEYDAPLTHCLNDQELFTDVSKVLSRFYLILKSQGDALRFLLVTGICRFQHLGIFSGPNQFIDLSLQTKFGTLLGYTVEDVEKFFPRYVQNAAGILGITAAQCMSQLKYHYDGYCFDAKAQTHVFCPWSVLNFLNAPDMGFVPYWIESSGGTPSVFVRYLQDHGLKSPEDYGRDHTIGISRLKSSEELKSLNDLSMLYHTGYLTIKGIDEIFGDLILNYPNHEVSESLAESYAAHSFGKDNLKGFIEKLLRAEPEEIIAELNRFLTSLDYKDFKLEDEAAVRSVVQLCLMIAGLNPSIENHNHKGRSDLEVRADERYFVFELKYHREGSGSPETLLEEAVRQIVDNHYGEQSFPELTHIRIAMVFSQQERRFSLWKIF